MNSKIEIAGGLALVGAFLAGIWWINQDPYAPEHIDSVDIGLETEAATLANATHQLRCVAAKRQSEDIDGCANTARPNTSSPLQEVSQ